MTKAADFPDVADMSPDMVWEELAVDPDSALVDVRTRPEWAFVGIPDISGLGRQTVLVEWRTYPTLSVNPNFVAELTNRLGGNLPGKLFFICRSGQRSREAAEFVLSDNSESSVICTNVAEGFEGDLDTGGHRGSINGWKQRGLAWRQS